jgi:NADH:ubiquinone oxidoreductase subunit 2 (subunit N)
LYYQDISRNQQISFFYDLHLSGIDRMRKIIFMLILMALLGTPATLGFFYKISVFTNLVGSSTAAIVSAALLNLMMIIFYLQAARHSQVLRKKRVRQLPEDVNTGSKGTLVLAAALALGAIFFAPALIEILVILLG